MALHTHGYLEGRGVVVRRDGGVFDINDARPIEWVITPGLDLFARGRFYAWARGGARGARSDPPPSGLPRGPQPRSAPPLASGA